PTVGTRYAAAAGVRAVDVTATEGIMPDIAALTGLTGGDSLLIGTTDAWSWTSPGTHERFVVWQAAPGVVGQVRATGLTQPELDRVVANAKVVGAGAPLGGPASHVVLRSDPAGPVDYQVQWAPTIEPEMGPCVVAVVDGVVVGPEC